MLTEKKKHQEELELELNSLRVELEANYALMIQQKVNELSNSSTRSVQELQENFNLEM